MTLSHFNGKVVFDHTPQLVSFFSVVIGDLQEKRCSLQSMMVTACLCVGIWIFTFIMISPLTFSLTIGLYKFGTFGYNAKIGKCDEVFYQHQNGFIPYGIIILLVGFFLPSILIIVSYIFIGINLELRKRKTEKILNMQTQVELP